MTFDKIVIHDRGMTPGEFPWDLQTVLEGIKRFLFDILRFNRKPGLPDVLDPCRAATAGGGLLHLNDRRGIGPKRCRENGCRSGNEKCSAFQWYLLFMSSSVLAM